MEIDAKHPKVPRLLELVKEREFEGYAYDGAEASFELLARRSLEDVPEYIQAAFLSGSRRTPLECAWRTGDRVGGDGEGRCRQS